MKKSFRFNVVVEFDVETQRDKVVMVEKVRQSKKTPEFVVAAIGFALDNPEEFEKYNSDMKKFGFSETRAKFIELIHKNMENLKKRIETMYEMLVKAITLINFNKMIGMEQKINNLKQATFVAELQHKQLCEILGVNDFSKIYENFKEKKVETLANEILEYIIEHNDNVIQEIKVNSTQTTTMQQMTDVNIVDKPTKDNNKSTIQIPQEEKTTPITSDTLLDFGQDEESFNLLSNFVGE